MKLPKYQLKSSNEFFSYEFISEGPKGIIIKQIQFTLINKEGIYNLGFGDKNTLTNQIDDLVISNNGDSEKVLATVVAAVYTFCEKYPKAWIFASGSTSSRTRLYQIGISKYLDEIKMDFEVYGQIDEDWEVFKIGKIYTAFLVRKK